MQSDRSHFRGMILATAVLCLTATMDVSTASAAEPKVIGTYKNWSAHLFAEKSGKVCYLHGVPSKSAGKYTKRGEIYLQVTHRTRPKTKNEVSITAGYAHKKNSEVKATIDGKTFVLFTDGDTAWAGDEKSDASMVAAMRAGRAMVVRGVSARGTATADTYSLAGFTAAHRAISKACGVK